LNETIDWHAQLEQNYRARARARLASKFEVPEPLSGPSCIEELKSGRYPLLIDSVVRVAGLQSNIDALEWISLGTKRKQGYYIPIRTSPREKPTREDKFLLAFDAIVLSLAVGQVPASGRIIHGKDFRVLKVKLPGLLKTARPIVEEIAKQQSSNDAPPPVLNKHCVQCGFRARCRKAAEERDDLSLLLNMSKAERATLHKKGIFSVHQLSHTFRVRRKRKHLLSNPDRYSHALKALAIREQQIHVVGAPQLPQAGTRIFLDVEGVPDRDLQYLIGLRIRHGESCTQHSFWADEKSDENTIVAALIETLSQFENAHLIYYGSYEKSFLRRMAKYYPEFFAGPISLDNLNARSTNLLQMIYGQIYFPTYSNSLKEIANYLGFRWFQNNPSALDSIIWRTQWETSREAELKERLITYNAEDCAALERVFNAISRLQKEPGSEDTAKTFVQVELLKNQTSLKFRKNDFVIPDLEYINSAAYWNYQRSKVYVRSNRRLKRLARFATAGPSLRLSLNAVVEDRSPLPLKCPKCAGETIYRYGWLSNKVCDIKFGKSGIKRWIAKYRHPRLICWGCKSTFSPTQRYSPQSKYGPGFMAYVLYNLVDLQISQAAVARTLNQFFGFGFTRHRINYVKSRAAEVYADTYKQILARLALGNLIHVDETTIRLQGRHAFVWVFTSFEDVAYVYSDTREAATPKTLLADFRGVLVTDFYAAYESINCRQQKCLIDLIRDLNDDIRRNPFNTEIQGLGQSFAILVRPMIQTIDQYGLKRHFLRKHLKPVEHFYKVLAKTDYQSEIAVKYRKRFDKNRSSLFTFLEYDGVPWNNNNAEHAIKALADLRNVIGGTSTPNGIREYLILLSICQTCKYRGISFLEFVRSGQPEIERFASRRSL
jgi:predicted RecB family nuclease